MGITISGRLILASASPRRIELLNLLGLAFEVMPSGVDEDSRRGETPREHAVRLAEEKALAVARRAPAAWVLGADTIVVVDREVLGKPRSAADAQAMLERLSGREHAVYTGFSIAGRGAGTLVRRVVESTVLFREIAPDEMAWYLASEEPYDKAGAYAIQGRGAFFIREIRGSYTNVVGLPLAEVVDALRDLSAVAFSGGDP